MTGLAHRLVRNHCVADALRDPRPESDQAVRPRWYLGRGRLEEPENGHRRLSCEARSKLGSVHELSLDDHRDGKRAQGRVGSRLSQPATIGLKETFTVVRLDRNTITLRTPPDGDGVAYEITLRRLE